MSLDHVGNKCVRNYAHTRLGENSRCRKEIKYGILVKLIESKTDHAITRRDDGNLGRRVHYWLKTRYLVAGILKSLEAVSGREIRG